MHITEAFTYCTCNILHVSAIYHCKIYFQCISPSACPKLSISLLIPLNFYSCNFYSLRFCFTLSCFRLHIMPSSEGRVDLEIFLCVRFPCIQFYQKAVTNFFWNQQTFFFLITFLPYVHPDGICHIFSRVLWNDLTLEDLSAEEAYEKIELTPGQKNSPRKKERKEGREERNLINLPSYTLCLWYWILNVHTCMKTVKM